jgi:hypothetical protein
MPYEACYPLGNFADEVVTPDDRRLAGAAILSPRNCSRPASARLRSKDTLTLKDRRSLVADASPKDLADSALARR